MYCCRIFAEDHNKRFSTSRPLWRTARFVRFFLRDKLHCIFFPVQLCTTLSTYYFFQYVKLSISSHGARSKNRGVVQPRAFGPCKTLAKTCVSSAPSIGNIFLLSSHSFLLFCQRDCFAYPLLTDLEFERRGVLDVCTCWQYRFWRICPSLFVMFVLTEAWKILEHSLSSSFLNSTEAF